MADLGASAASDDGVMDRFEILPLGSNQYWIARQIVWDLPETKEIFDLLLARLMRDALNVYCSHDGLEDGGNTRCNGFYNVDVSFVVRRKRENDVGFIHEGSYSSEQ